MHFNEFECIRIGKEWMFPQFVDLQILKKLGFKKTKEYSLEYEEYFTIWVKKPKIKAGLRE